MANDRTLGGNSSDGRANADAAANWCIVSLLTLGAFLGLSVTAFATGLLPGDISLRQELLEQRTSIAHGLAEVVNQAGTWRVLLPATLLLFLLSRAARRHWWLWCASMVGSSLIEHRQAPRGPAAAEADSLSAFRAATVRRWLAPARRHAVQVLAMS